MTEPNEEQFEDNEPTAVEFVDDQDPENTGRREITGSMTIMTNSPVNLIVSYGDPEDPKVEADFEIPAAQPDQQTGEESTQRVIRLDFTVSGANRHTEANEPVTH